ncbi:hypothetical protein DTO027B5_5412 [Paecilomyces variotii]|nr:hypothetical protein DTO032I3_1179 [Paecilomyces variotii]KAJ9277817.1 hypothetical protein DTO021D3_5400 [Paecilomyces variotii]KAJ9326246.1 hypothetical protein DTO027B3_2893 [Paecilomyces variotii]KAJ9332802.1 hypothetical protein DTO027B5_5412 [Paecilomyces variotii]KAJ9341005.1 hypothetical protein DTO027B6_6417 [Paecilomyces variotii]
MKRYDVPSQDFVTDACLDSLLVEGDIELRSKYAHWDHPRKRAQALVWCNGRVSVLAIARIAHSGWWDARGGRDGKHHPLRILSQFGKGSLGPWRKRISRWPTIAATVSINPVRAPGRPVIIIIVAFRLRLHRPSSGSLSYALAAEGTVLLVVLTAARKRPDLTASSPASTCLAPLLPAPTPWLLTSSIPSSSLHPPSCPERHCQLDGLTWDIASSTPPQRLRIFIQVPLWVVSLSHRPPPLLSPGTPTIATNFTLSFRQCAASKPCLRLPVGAGNLIPRSRNHPGFWRNHDKTTVASLTQICAIASLRSVMSRFGIRFPVIRPDSSKKEHAAVASDDAGVSDGSLTVLSAEAFPSIAPLLSLWHDPRGASTATCVCHTWLGRERYDIILKLRCRIPSPSVTRIIVSQQPITQLSDVQFLLGNSM